MTKKQKNDYELSLKRIADEYATNKTSYNKGIDIGRVKEKIEIIKTLLAMGEMPISKIANITSVDEAYVLKLKARRSNSGNNS